MIPKSLAALAALLLGFFAARAHAEVTACTNITSLPRTISAPGVYCLKQDLATSMTTGAAIIIAANNVILDLNGFKLGGLGGGINTQADGISSLDRLNVTIRNGTIRGFFHNIRLSGTSESTSSGHLVEDVRSESGRYIGISVQGSQSIIRRNFVFGIGDGVAATAYGIVAQLGEGISVEHNTVTKVNETGSAYGIYTSSGLNAYVANNTVRNVNSSNISYGIYSAGIIRNNVVSNTNTGTFGIYAYRDETFCVDNLIIYFNTKLVACSNSIGNRVF